MSSTPLHERFEKALASHGPEALLMAMVAVFVIGAAIVLRLVSMHDYIEDINGAITTDIRPARLISEDQFLIARVYRNLGDEVRRGDPLLQLDGARQRVTLAKLEQTLQARQSELDYNRARLAGIEQKLELNQQIISRKLRLAAIDSSQVGLTVELDAKRQKAAREIQVLSEKILARTIPALDTPALSEIEKARVLSNAHADLRQMHQITSEVRANQHKAERDGLLTQIEVAELKDERADLDLSRTDIGRTITALQGEIDSIRQERAQIQDALTRLLVRAPADGSIIRVSEHILNANLVEKNEEMFLIQSRGSRLEAELVLTDEQFKDARVGQKVNLELHAWNHYKYGAIRGEIAAISASKILPQVFRSKDPAFVATVRIEPGQETLLRAGYDLKARVILGRISLFDYVLKKVRVQ